MVFMGINLVLQSGSVLAQVIMLSLQAMNAKKSSEENCWKNAQTTIIVLSLVAFINFVMTAL
jgi:hypothetical protein